MLHERAGHARNPDPNHDEAASNPLASGQSGVAGWSRTRLDALGRVVDVTSLNPANPTDLPYPWGVTMPEVAVTSYAYDGDLTTVTDPSGLQRSSRVDALGRTVEVKEDPAGKNYSTLYTYDVLDNLTNVSQGNKPPTFIFSSLSRLLSADNPESGVTAYTYDINGNLLTKLDAVSITTSFVYDALNRIAAKSYTNGVSPAVAYAYYSCPRGSLCSVTNSKSATSYTYDNLAQVVTSTQSKLAPGAVTDYLFRYQ